jgi:hypothetical protein
MTNETKQTAVDWQFDQLSSENLLGIFTHEQMTRVMEILEQAKEIEKKRIIKAFDDGDYNYHYSRKTGNDFENGEEYFEELYGGNK